MNHCRDCNSDYATPGTCNCFAVGGKRHAGTQGGTWWPYVPYAPYLPYSPWVQPTTPPWQPYWGGTITVGDIPNPPTTITVNPAVTFTGVTNIGALADALDSELAKRFNAAGGLCDA